MDIYLLLFGGKVIFTSFRSENSVKNRFYGSIRKMVRLLNRIPKEKGNKKSKPIKYESILRVIELADEGFKDH